jgi:hypothetical protein
MPTFADHSVPFISNPVIPDAPSRNDQSDTCVQPLMPCAFYRLTCACTYFFGLFQKSTKKDQDKNMLPIALSSRTPAFLSVPGASGKTFFF